MTPLVSYPTYLRPFFTYFGGKWNLAPYYPAPKYDTIIEPFSGSAGYSLNHYRKNVILFEIDPKVASVWRYLIRASPADILSLPNLSPGDLVSSLDICFGAKCLIGFWCGRGSTKPRNRLTGWGRNGNYANRYWGDAAKKRIASQVEYIKHWRIVESSYEASALLNDDLSTWFIDPPYQVAGQSYYYNHIDYSLLSKWCLELKGQVIVCESGDSSLWLPFSHLTMGLGSRGRLNQEMVFYQDRED